MKIAPFFLLPFVAIASVAACKDGTYSQTKSSAIEQALNSNVTVLVAAQALTDEIFVKEAPKVAAAVTNLPESTQVLVQTAFAALQKGIDEAEAMAWGELSATEQALAGNVLDGLRNAAKSLHGAIHEAQSAVPPTVPLTDPNGLPVALTIPTADPGATVVVNPNTTLLLTNPNQLNSLSPNYTITLDPNFSKISPLSPLMVAP